MKNLVKDLEQKFRRQLLSNATGNVLEVGVGTGLNFPYYPAKVAVTATDASARIIERAKVSATAHGVKANFIVSPVEALQLPAQQFDTVVSTFSLCSYNNPVSVLNRFNDWCRPGGNILLLEHGLSNIQLVQWMQRKWEPYFYRASGCHLDRDIKRILECAQPVVKRIERRACGIIYIAELRRRREVEGVRWK